MIFNAQEECSRIIDNFKKTLLMDLGTILVKIKLVYAKKIIY